MAETNSADLEAVLERVLHAMNKSSEELGRTKPKMHPLLLALAGSLVVIFIGGLVTWGGLQARVTSLESRTQNIDQLRSIDAKVDSIMARFATLEERFNQMADNQSARRR